MVPEQTPASKINCSPSASFAPDPASHFLQTGTIKFALSFFCASAFPAPRAATNSPSNTARIRLPPFFPFGNQRTSSLLLGAGSMPTGIATLREGEMSLRSQRPLRMVCPACGRVHDWTKADAWLDDTGEQYRLAPIPAS